MNVKKWATCAFLFLICYVIIIYLDKSIEGFRGGGRGGFGRGIGRGRGYYGGRGYGPGYGMGYGMGYGYGRGYYPVPVVINDDSNYLYPSFLYPSYWYRYFN